MLCGFREVSLFVKTARIHLKQATYLHCIVKISHSASYPVCLISISDPFKGIWNETIYQCGLGLKKIYMYVFPKTCLKIIGLEGWFLFLKKLKNAQSDFKYTIKQLAEV